MRANPVPLRDLLQLLTGQKKDDVELCLLRICRSRSILRVTVAEHMSHLKSVVFDKFMCFLGSFSFLNSVHFKRVTHEQVPNLFIVLSAHRVCLHFGGGLICASVFAWFGSFNAGEVFDSPFFDLDPLDPEFGSGFGDNPVSGNIVIDGKPVSARERLDI